MKTQKEATRIMAFQKAVELNDDELELVAGNGGCQKGGSNCFTWCLPDGTSYTYCEPLADQLV